MDGRYSIQAKKQTKSPFEVTQWNKKNFFHWIEKNIVKGKIGFDPWLHSHKEIFSLSEEFANSGISFAPSDNLIEKVWMNRPSKTSNKVMKYPVELAGLSAREKCQKIAEKIRFRKANSAVITLPDSIAWLLNLRGSDVIHNPIFHAFLIIDSEGHVKIFCRNENLLFSIKGLESFVKVFL